jgi:hypothetical protein
MAQKIEFNYENTHYVLEFSRNVVRQMEATGFVISEIDTKPMTRIPQLFEGAFVMHHRKERKEKITEIFSHFTRKDDLIMKLTEMYYEAMTTLIDDEEVENDTKKIEW